MRGSRSPSPARAACVGLEPEAGLECRVTLQSFAAA